MSVLQCSECSRKVKARGLCDIHYKRAWRAGTLPAFESRLVPDLKTEEWLPLSGFDRVMVSDAGRAKTTKRGEKLLNPFCLPHRNIMAISAINNDGRSRNVGLARAVLGTFRGQKGSNVRVNYLDGDYTNCRLDNLRWADDVDYYLPLAMTKALLSDHPDSGPLFSFMAGDSSALDHIFAELFRTLPYFVNRLSLERAIPFDVDPEGIVQEALFEGCLAIRRGKVNRPEKLRNWFVGCAKTIFLEKVNEPRECLSLIAPHDSGHEMGLEING